MNGLTIAANGNPQTGSELRLSRRSVAATAVHQVRSDVELFLSAAAARCGASSMSERRAVRAGGASDSNMVMARARNWGTSIPIPIGKFELVLCHACGTTRSARISGREFRAPNQSHSPTTSITCWKIDGIPIFALIVTMRDRSETRSATFGCSCTKA